MTYSLGIFILGLFLMAQSGSAASHPILLVEEVIIPLPDDWSQVSENEYPFHFVDSNHLAEVLLFKSVLPSEDAVANKDELHESVAAVAADLLPALQKPQMLRSSGYLENGRAWFVLDFISTDSASTVEIFHRLKGVLYRLPDNSQLLFTLWARTSPEDLPFLEKAIDQIQSGFAYQGAFESQVFVDDSDQSPWYFPMGVMILLGLLIYLGRLRNNQARIKFAKSQTLWRCDCGRLNHTDRTTCRRCGQTQLVA